MEIELFTVKIKSDGKFSLVINETLLISHKISREEFEEKVKLDNLYKGIEEFCEPFLSKE